MNRNERRILREYNRYMDEIFANNDYDFRDKKSCIYSHITYMFNRTQSMFKWTGLPETIPQRNLEFMLQMGGCVAIYKYNSDLYAFNGGLGGEPDVYYMPTIFTISNPALKLSVNAKINEDCIVIPNDSMYCGLMPLFERHAYMQTENELSMLIALINSRIPSLINSDNDSTTKSAEKYLSDIEEGKLGIIASSAFLEGIKTQPYGITSNTNILTNLIESEQYIKASWYNDLGLNANYNMKRESINSGESQLNDDALLPLVDDMLRCRQNAIKKVNEKFGTNISIDLYSAWKDNEIELNSEQNNIDEGGEENAVSNETENA